MKTTFWTTLGAVMLVSAGALQINTADTGLDTWITPFEAYVDASQDTILRLEPLFIAYQAAADAGDTKQADALLHRIVLMNTLEEWRWKFYQHGQHHLKEMDSRERMAWEYAKKTVGGRSTPPDPEDMLKMSPDHIRNALIREKIDIADILKKFEKLPEPLRVSSDTDRGTDRIMESAQQTHSTDGTTQPKLSLDTFLAPVAIVGAVIVGIAVYIFRRRSS